MTKNDSVAGMSDQGVSTILSALEDMAGEMRSVRHDREHHIYDHRGAESEWADQIEALARRLSSLSPSVQRYAPKFNGGRVEMFPVEDGEWVKAEEVNALPPSGEGLSAYVQHRAECEHKRESPWPHPNGDGLCWRWHSGIVLEKPDHGEPEVQRPIRCTCGLSALLSGSGSASSQETNGKEKEG